MPNMGTRDFEILLLYRQSSTLSVGLKGCSIKDDAGMGLTLHVCRVCAVANILSVFINCETVVTA